MEVSRNECEASAQLSTFPVTISVLTVECPEQRMQTPRQLGQWDLGNWELWWRSMLNRECDECRPGEKY